MSSYLEENQMPSGYPLRTCKATLEPKYLCSHCKGVLRRALQTACGHRYCSACLAWIIQNNKNPVCQSCKAEDPSTINEESLLSVETAFSDAAIDKEISELDVHCGISGCSWTGNMKSLEVHEGVCEYVLIPCHVGCRLVVMRKNLADHLQNNCMNTTPSSRCNQKDFGNKQQDASTVSSGEDECPFSRLGCLFKGNKTERKEHETVAAEIHLVLLLQHVKQLKATLGPADDGANVCLRDSPILNGIFLSLHLQGPLEVDSFLGWPVCEEESRWQMLLRRAKGVSLLDTKLQVFENITSVLSKEVDASRQKIVAFRRQRGLDQDMIRGLELKIADLQRCLAQKDAAMGRLQERLQLSKQASYDGVFLWKITDAHRKCYEAMTGKVCCLQSPAFYTAQYGYKLCMRIFLNGEGKGKGTHVSVSLVLLKGDYDALLQWPFPHKITFMLLNQNSGEHLLHTFHPDPTSASFQRPVTVTNEASGCPKFLPLAKLQSPKYAYLKEGTLFLKCITEVSS